MGYKTGFRGRGGGGWEVAGVGVGEVLDGGAVGVDADGGGDGGRGVGFDGASVGAGRRVSFVAAGAGP